MDVATAGFQLGEGVYSLPEAARIIGRAGPGVTPRQLQYWLKSGLTEATGRTQYGYALSFADLVSLEIVRRFRVRDVSLQRVRKLEVRLRDKFPTLERPFAHRVFFTDGARIWISENPDDPEGLLDEVVGEHAGHRVWGAAIESFAREIRFDPESKAAVAWDLNPWVEINPAVQFGAPVVAGTRVPARTVVANLEAGSPAEVADWYGLTVEQVEGVKAYFVG